MPARSMRNSSKSRNDMWQPEQPPSQTVATRSRDATGCVLAVVAESVCILLATGWKPVLRDPLFFGPCGNDEFQFVAVAFHLGNGRAFIEECSSGARHDALAA